LGNTQWDISNTDIIICYSKFHDTFKSLYAECFPVSVKVIHKLNKGRQNYGFRLDKSVHKKQVIADQKQISDKCNQFFAYVGSDLAKKYS